MKAMRRILKSKTGGILLITIIILSLMIVLLMSAATLKLAEVARQGARASEQLRFMNAMEDIAQQLARAKILGAAVQPCSPKPCTPTPAACPTGTTAINVGSPVQRLCVFTVGITGAAAAVGSICADLDQNATTTHDQYCVRAINSVIGQNDLDDFNRDAEKRYYANIDTRSKFMRVLSALLIPIADAACDWWGCDATAPVGGGGSGSALITERHFPPAVAAGDIPSSTATQTTDGGTALPRNNMEQWSPNIAAWASSNEILTPDCSTINTNETHDSQKLFWLGCMRCNTQGVTCFRVTVCPPRNPTCNAATEGYEQMIGMW